MKNTHVLSINIIWIAGCTTACSPSRMEVRHTSSSEECTNYKDRTSSNSKRSYSAYKPRPLYPGDQFYSPDNGTLCEPSLLTLPELQQGFSISYFRIRVFDTIRQWEKSVRLTVIDSNRGVESASIEAKVRKSSHHRTCQALISRCLFCFICTNLGRSLFEPFIVHPR
jgi:hypothetical protein